MKKNRLNLLMFSAFLTSVLLFFPSLANSQDDQQEQEITNPIGMRLKEISAGSFIMGAVPGDDEANIDEKPQHRVEITKAFYIGVYEVTQAQWQAVMGTNPSYFKGSRRPVEQVSWNDAVEFCRRLSQREGVTYRLPTEAEWEYACRAGTTTKFYWGNNMNGDYAWYRDNSGGKTHKVGRKQPNGWGLYDMSGNVWEWCSDWYDEGYYGRSPAKDPVGPSSGMYRVVRSGCWTYYTANIRSSNRVRFSPDDWYYNNGFRVVREKVITNPIGMRLKEISAGSFIMGAVPGDDEANIDEKPQHRVEITKAFYIGVYEVTQAQWQAVMGTNPSYFKGSRRPVEQVSWNDAVEFCRRLSQREGVTYRLPTEAEWEYACRAGTTTKFYWGNNMNGDYAWYRDNSGGKTHKVGRKQPNGWGLYDMSGNVWEWCSDWYDEGYYGRSPAKDPVGPSSGMYRVVRGGCWTYYTANIRSSNRVRFSPDDWYYNNGFRVVREVE